MSQVNAVSWWSDEQPKIEKLLMKLKEEEDISAKILTGQSDSEKEGYYAVIIKAREGGNADDFNFGLVTSEGLFDCRFSLTRIKTVHGKKYPLNCMTDRKVVRDLKEIVSKLNEEDKLVQISEDVFNQIVAIRPT